MKKFLVAIACIACAFSASAQKSTSFFSTEKADQEITWGVRFGMNVSNMKESGNGYSATGDSKIGANLGVSVDIPMLQSLYIQSGLYYTTKGAKYQGYKATPQYLEIPVMASYRYNFTEATQLQVNFGPYFAVGVAGKEKYDGGGSEKLFSGDYATLKRFDAGLGIGAGVTFDRYFVGLNYQFGLANIMKDAPASAKTKNRNFSISVGYNF